MQSFEIIKGQGGVPKELAGRDHICGLLFFLPATQASEVTEVKSFGTYAEAETAYKSLADAESEGTPTGLGYKVVLYQIKELFRLQPAAKVCCELLSN